MDIQTEVQKIHHKYGVSEKANYEIQKLFEKAIKQAKNEALRKPPVSGSLPTNSEFWAEWNKHKDAQRLWIWLLRRQ